MQNYNNSLGREKNRSFDAGPFLLILGGFALAIGIPFMCQLSPVDHVYSTGYLLQFSAFLVIIVRLFMLRNYIGSLIYSIKRTLSNSKPINVYGRIANAPQSIEGTISTTRRSAVKILEEKVAALEGKHKLLEQKLEETYDNLNKQDERLVDAFKSERKKWDKNIKYDIVWPVWLLFGLNIRFFSEEIGRWLM